MSKWLYLGACALGSALFTGAQAEAAPQFCGEPTPAMAETCAVYQTYCAAYLDDPASLDRSTLREIPSGARARFAASELTQVTLGYRTTANPQVAVVYGDEYPSCELLMTGMQFSDLLIAYRDWREGEGAQFAATAPFEPVSKREMPRAYAAVFLAAPREDGRVTEITLNWNLSEAGLTRLKVSYQPEREHTRLLLGQGAN
ncbi:hypothetical protein KX928_01520 [Roseobacter sp. YSTF-M11]|uniref:Uncharacterized protein n=1 Tax=Roseobacter insulae TaxID=2859783 RepID=A0A9X1K0G8_9RHOB|nr:hypothetical protein [Roseobacter insulae]MBW4706453.1 hypothetical protein [Roseobacter insulae]